MSDVCLVTGRNPGGHIVPCSGYGRAHTGAHIFEDPQDAPVVEARAEVKPEPHTDTEKRRRQPMMIRFSDSERALLDAEAEEVGMATGTYIRTTAVRAAKDAQKKRKQES